MTSSRLFPGNSGPRETGEDLALPVALTEVAEVLRTQEPPKDDDIEGGAYIDFEPYEQFMTPAEFARTFRLWTGNNEVDGGEFRVFGSTGAGDHLGFWLVRPGAPVDEQPVFYLGSDGDTAMMARDLGDLLWYFANGFLYDADPNERLQAVAERHAPGRRRPNEEIEAAADAEFPDFTGFMNAMCR